MNDRRPIAQKYPRLDLNRDQLKLLYELNVRKHENRIRELQKEGLFLDSALKPLPNPNDKE